MLDVHFMDFVAAEDTPQGEAAREDDHLALEPIAQGEADLDD